jgi:hypothetical protein
MAFIKILNKAFMKKIIVLFVLAVFISGVHAQTFSEWFRQGSTQKKYLAQQIAALEAYILVAKKGYDISQKGLSTIGDIKNGDFGLHSLYFGSLKAVNPEIAKSPRIGDIISLQQNIITISNQSKSKASQSHLFTTPQTDYINGIYDRLHKDCLATLDELETVTTPGKLELKDDERISRIEKLYSQSLSQYGFARNFGNNLLVMMLQKNGQNQDSKTVRSLYDIQ